jgi:hypothetical protein
MLISSIPPEIVRTASSPPVVVEDLDAIISLAAPKE